MKTLSSAKHRRDTGFLYERRLRAFPHMQSDPERPREKDNRSRPKGRSGNPSFRLRTWQSLLYNCTSNWADFTSASYGQNLAAHLPAERLWLTHFAHACMDLSFSRGGCYFPRNSLHSSWNYLRPADELPSPTLNQQWGG